MKTLLYSIDFKIHKNKFSLYKSMEKKQNIVFKNHKNSSLKKDADFVFIPYFFFVFFFVFTFLLINLSRFYILTSHIFYFIWFWKLIIAKKQSSRIGFFPVFQFPECVCVCVGCPLERIFHFPCNNSSWTRKTMMKLISVIKKENNWLRILPF